MKCYQCHSFEEHTYTLMKHIHSQIFHVKSYIGIYLSAWPLRDNIYCIKGLSNICNIAYVKATTSINFLLKNINYLLKIIYLM